MYEAMFLTQHNATNARNIIIAPEPVEQKKTPAADVVKQVIFGLHMSELLFWYVLSEKMN